MIQFRIVIKKKVIYTSLQFHFLFPFLNHVQSPKGPDCMSLNCFKRSSLFLLSLLLPFDNPGSANGKLRLLLFSSYISATSSLFQKNVVQLSKSFPLQKSCSPCQKFGIGWSKPVTFIFLTVKKLVSMILNRYLREKRSCPAVINFFPNAKKMVSVVKRLESKEEEE